MSERQRAQRIALAVSDVVDAARELHDAMKDAPECAGALNVLVSVEDFKTWIVGFTFNGVGVGYRVENGAITGFTVEDEEEEVGHDDVPVIPLHPGVYTLEELAELQKRILRADD